MAQEKMKEADTSHRNWPRARRAGDTLYIGGQIAVDTNVDIQAQTAAVFDRLVASLGSADLGMPDLTKLHTYYQCNVEGPAVTEYWERMTQVRLRYLPDPGPAATAVRVSGAPTNKHLIEIDGYVVIGADRRRLMPAHAWDWSIPTPFSQGWRVGDKVILGGQISADRQGKAVAAGNIREQTKNTLEYIRHILLEGGSGWNDLVSLKICFKGTGEGKQDRELLAVILDEIRQTIPEPRPALTVFGVDLLYEGLVLEIDGIAVLGEKAHITPSGVDTWVTYDGFPQAWRSGDEVYAGGISAPGAAGLTAQAEASLERLEQVLRSAGAAFENLAKVSVFYVADNIQSSADDYQTIQDVLSAYLPEPRPVVSVVAVPALGHEGQRFQIDGVAVIGEASRPTGKNTR